MDLFEWFESRKEKGKKKRKERGTAGPAQNPSPFLSLGPPFPPLPAWAAPRPRLPSTPRLSLLSLFPRPSTRPARLPLLSSLSSPVWAVPAQRTHPLRPSARTAPSLSPRAQRSFLSLMNRARLSSPSSRTPSLQARPRSPAPPRPTRTSRPEPDLFKAAPAPRVPQVAAITPRTPNPSH
jgi:hypothetical protein